VCRFQVCVRKRLCKAIPTPTRRSTSSDADPDSTTPTRSLAAAFAHVCEKLNHRRFVATIIQDHEEMLTVLVGGDAIFRCVLRVANHQW